MKEKWTGLVSQDHSKLWIFRLRNEQYRHVDKELCNPAILPATLTSYIFNGDKCFMEPSSSAKSIPPLNPSLPLTVAELEIRDFFPPQRNEVKNLA